MRSMCRALIKKTPKVSRDLNPDIRINPDSDPDVYRIAPKMLWIYYLVGVSHFAEFVKISQWREMLINLIKSLFRNSEGSRKVTQNPYSEPNHHQYHS